METKYGACAGTSESGICGKTCCREEKAAGAEVRSAVSCMDRFAAGAAVRLTRISCGCGPAEAIIRRMCFRILKTEENFWKMKAFEAKEKLFEAKENFWKTKAFEIRRKQKENLK